MNNTFGTPTDLTFPTGRIHAKVEGTIDNSTATPDKPTQAFYAKEVSVKTGPVVPPNVPQPPFTGLQTIHLPGINPLGGQPSSTASVPKGPLAKKG